MKRYEQIPSKLPPPLRLGISRMMVKTLYGRKFAVLTLFRKVWVMIMGTGETTGVFAVCFQGKEISMFSGVLI
jgi:hypothetical protein